MIPIDPLLSAPGQTFNKLKIHQAETDGFIKKAAKHLHNGTIRFFCTALVTIACIVGLILACVVNLLTAPFVGIHNLVKTAFEKKEFHHPIQPGKVGFFAGLFKMAGPKHYPKLKDFDGPPENGQKSPIPTVDFSAVSFKCRPEIKDKDLPLTFQRSDQRTGPPPEKLHKWPALNAERTNTFFLKFLHNEVTVPGSETTFWGLLQQAGTSEGHQYLEEVSTQLVPTLFPASTPSPLNPKAPLLSREAVTDIQTNPKTTARYLALLATQLQNWGLQITLENGQLVIKEQEDVFNERASAISTLENRELLFQQVLSSLADSGFPGVALQLAQLLITRFDSYDINPVNIQNTMQELFEREQALEGTVAQTIETLTQIGNIQESDKATIYWNAYRNSLPSASGGSIFSPDATPRDILATMIKGPRPIVTSTLAPLWDGKTPLHEISQVRAPSSFDTILIPPKQSNKTFIIDPEEGPMEIIPETRPSISGEYLQAPQYFFSLKTEKTLIQEILQNQRAPEEEGLPFIPKNTIRSPSPKSKDQPSPEPKDKQPKVKKMVRILETTQVFGPEGEALDPQKIFGVGEEVPNSLEDTDTHPTEDSAKKPSPKKETKGE